MSDVYVIGLQEFVPLKTKEAIQGKNKERAGKWRSEIEKALSSIA